MAKHEADYITLDLFADTPKVGRPRTNPLPRQQQLRLNKRNQLRRDKTYGLRRVEIKLHEKHVEQLELLAKQHNFSRAEYIETILLNYLKLQEMEEK